LTGNREIQTSFDPNQNRMFRERNKIVQQVLFNYILSVSG